MNRRIFLNAAISAGAVAAANLARVGAGAAIDDRLQRQRSRRAGGNPKGDVPTVALLDYNCQYCKKSAPDLDGIVKIDGGVRLVYRPFFLDPQSHRL